MGPLFFLWFAFLPGMCVSGAAAEPKRLQEAVRDPARAGAGVDRSRRRSARQLHLDAQRSAGTAAHVQRGALHQLRRPGPDPEDGEPGVQWAGAEPAEAAPEAVWGECVWRPVLSWME